MTPSQPARLGEALREIERLRFRVAMLNGKLRRPFRPCPYCGAETRGETCPSHRDLLRVDEWTGR